MKYQDPGKRRKSGKGSVAVDPLGPNTDIGRKLRQYYDELLIPDIPDRFKQLLGDLEKNERTENIPEEPPRS